MRTKTGKIKRIICSILTTVLMVGLIAVPTENAQAASKVNVPEAIHLYTGNWTDYTIRIEFDHLGDKVENIKTDSENLKAMVTFRQCLSSTGTNFAHIGTYAKRKGTYTLSFDICGSNNEKLSSHSVKVYVNKDYAVKTATFNGQEITGSTVSDKASGKLKITMNKGYDINKIVVQTFDKNGKQKSKTIKNNSKIKLGKYADTSKAGDKKENYYRMDSSVMAETRISVYYTDKYTKTERTALYNVRRPAV